MLRLNRMTDYAILVLGVLHGRPGQLLSSAQIAQHAQLTQATVAKTIKALVAAGLITTIRGTKGPRAARRDAQITGSVSLDLLMWKSSAPDILLIEDEANHLLFRSATPIGDEPKQFMKAEVVIP